MINLYKLPLNFDLFFESRTLKLCASVKESLDQYIYLILMTEFGDSRFDPEFGCEIWDVDFQLIFSINQWKDKMQKSIFHTVGSYEPRLQDIHVSVDVLDEHEELKNAAGIKLRRKMTVTVRARMAETGLPYQYSHPIYLNPISID